MLRIIGNKFKILLLFFFYFSMAQMLLERYLASAKRVLSKDIFVRKFEIRLVINMIFPICVIENHQSFMNELQTSKCQSFKKADESFLT